MSNEFFTFARRPNTRYWLMKSEPKEVSIDHVLAAPESTVPWSGIRNFQARNFMRDGMSIGDGVLFYHSSCPEPGIAGIARVASDAYPDPTQFDPASPYHDRSSEPGNPRWLLVDVRALAKTRLLSLRQMRAAPALQNMNVLKRGSRLSITPVEQIHWDLIVRHLVTQPLTDGALCLSEPS